MASRPMGSAAGKIGYYSDYPVAGKVADKSIYGRVQRVLEDPLDGASRVPDTFYTFRSGPLLLAP